MKTIHLVSGLPRSGSTLLQNILAQNPRFHATPTSGCVDTFMGIRNNWNLLPEHKASPCHQKLLNVLRATLDAYFLDVPQPVVFDKGRSWLAYIEFVESILKTTVKVLVPVRPVPDILSSMEKLYRKTSHWWQPPGEAQNYFQFQTVRDRCKFWMRDDQLVGLALNRVEDACIRGLRDRLHFVSFDELTSNPQQTMAEIYEYLGETLFTHDFDHVKQVTQEDDSIYGFIDLHWVRSKVAPVKSDAEQVLGKEVVQSFKKSYN